MFICGTPLGSTKGMDGLLESNFDKAASLLKQRAVVFVVGDISERVEPEDEWEGFRRCCGHFVSLV